GQREPAARWKLRPAFLALGVLVVVAAVGFSSWWKERRPVAPETPIRSVAVLPFKPLVAADTEPYLELGIADTLITRLSTLGQLTVRPTSAIRKYAGIEQDPLAAGRELGVEAVLEGSLQRVDDRVRVTV